MAYLVYFLVPCKVLKTQQEKKMFSLKKKLQKKKIDVFYKIYKLYVSVDAICTCLAKYLTKKINKKR